MKTKFKKTGFTLIETIVAVLIFTLAMGMALTGYLFTIKKVNQGEASNRLNRDVQMAMNRLQNDLNYSSLDHIFYSGGGFGTNTAISFPLLKHGNSNPALDASNKIIWEETVIYHIRPGTPYELVRTVFPVRDNTLSDVQRKAQLASVIASGGAAGASSKVLLKNLESWSITPKAGQFDAYSPVEKRETVTLGYAPLTPGAHTFTFSATNKNPLSSSYKIGIDKLFVSASGLPREAEDQTGAPTPKEKMSIAYGGRNQLAFNNPSSSFTLSIKNDSWEETDFTGDYSFKLDHCAIQYDDTLNDSVVKLSGWDTTWSAKRQTQDQSNTIATPWDCPSYRIRTLIKGSDIGGKSTLQGNELTVTFQASDTQDLHILEAWIGESAATNTATMDYAFPLDFVTNRLTFDYNSPMDGEVLIPANSSVESQWLSHEFNPDKNYLVSFEVANTTNSAAPKFWRNHKDDGSGNKNFDNDTYTTYIHTGGVYAVTAQTWDPAHPIGNALTPSADPLPSGIIENPTQTNSFTVAGVESIFVSYPPKGTYTSPICDRNIQSDIPVDSVSENYTVNAHAGGTLLEYRSSNNKLDFFNPSWNGWSKLLPEKRYMQFKVEMTSQPQSPHSESPLINDITLGWPGENKMTDISGVFTKGPEYGIIEVLVDGEPLNASLVVDLEIFEDLPVGKGQTSRITAGKKIEIRPRNSGL